MLKCEIKTVDISSCDASLIIQNEEKMIMLMVGLILLVSRIFSFLCGLIIVILHENYAEMFYMKVYEMKTLELEIQINFIVHLLAIYYLIS